VRRRLLIEGWRFIHHSYALVAQAHCLCLLRKNDIDLRFLDVPYTSRTWRRTSGLFAPDEEAALASIAAPEPAFVPEVTLTITAGGPNLSVPASGRRFVFGTPGFRVVRREASGGFRRGSDIPEVIHFLTPSRWTAVAFERFGVPLDRIHVVPHGIDPDVFRPDESKRLAMRGKLDIAEHFVFLSTGSMTMVKGIDLLLA
jgi:glycosyltransferase involved in cell wall biosynthesis